MVLKIKMKFVINSEGLLVSVNDINLGTHRSSIYQCPDCREDVIYVSASSRCVAHFKHRPESRCTFDGDLPPEIYSNKMSDFHRNWQRIFPPQYLERKIGNNRADIYLRSEKKFNLGNQMFKDFEPKNLVIEIQNSKISYTDLVQRQTVYKNVAQERELLWIFNLEKCQVEIGRIRGKEEIVLKFKGGDTSFMNLLNIKNTKACILLDNGGSNLYYVSNNPKCDKEFIEVTIVDRIQLLRELSVTFNLDLKWEHEMKKDVIVEFEPVPIKVQAKPLNVLVVPKQQPIQNIQPNEFNTKWLDIFHEIETNKKFGNVYLEGKDLFNLVDDLGNIILKSTDLMIQFDKRYFPGIIITETQNIRKKSNSKADMLWVIDLDDYEYNIEYIKTYVEEKYVISFKGDASILDQLTSSKINVLFDGGGSNLYYASNLPLSNSQTCVQVTMVDRMNLMFQLNSFFNLDLKWPHKMEINNIEKYDYESICSSLEDKLDMHKINEIRKCFYLMELINSYFLMNDTEYWHSCDLFIRIGGTLCGLSNRDYLVKNMWIRWVMKNKPCYDDEMPFGKYEGTELQELPLWYLKIAKDFNFKNKELRDRIIVLSYYDRKTLEFYYNQEDDCIGALIYLYREFTEDKKWSPPCFPTRCYSSVPNNNISLNSIPRFSNYSNVKGYDIQAAVKAAHSKSIKGV